MHYWLSPYFVTTNLNVKDKTINAISENKVQLSKNQVILHFVSRTVLKKGDFALLYHQASVAQ